MTSTPTKPTATAENRLTPTFSPRKGMESSVMSSGAMKKSAVASASGIAAIAPKKARFAATMHSPRAI